MRRSYIVLDTNVLVSALVFGGVPREVLTLVMAGRVICSLSLPILDELRDVLQRPKFGLSLEQAVAIVEELSEICTIVSPTETLQVIDADPADNRILECAIKAKATFIVSGDSHLLALAAHEGIWILRPSEFLQRITSADDERARRKRRR
jgi:putative PIN family toxin of toxin-antitoxin system